MRQSIDSPTSAASLEINCRWLLTATLQPWSRVQHERPGRFRPGWTNTVDSMNKQPTTLLHSEITADKALAQELYKTIKRSFRETVKQLCNKLGQGLERDDPSRDCQILNGSSRSNRNKKYPGHHRIGSLHGVHKWTSTTRTPHTTGPHSTLHSPTCYGDRPRLSHIQD